MSRKTKQEILDIIQGSTGTEVYHRFSPFTACVATDGVLALAKVAECFWLLDVIASHQINENLNPLFQVWELTVNRDESSAIVHGYNDTTLVVTQYIPYTDFPLETLRLYLINGVILLPSEY
jgi:hypothetical protein